MYDPCNKASPTTPSCDLDSTFLLARLHFSAEELLLYPWRPCLRPHWKCKGTFCIFSAPEPKAQVHYCDRTLSVVRLSSVVVNFSHFRLLFWNRWMEFNEIWQEARSQRPLPSLCFSGQLEKQDGRPGFWLVETFSTSLKPLNRIQQNLTGSKISTSSIKFVFTSRSEKHDGRPDLWLAETFSTSPLKLLNRIQRNLTGSKIWRSSTNFVIFGPIGKTRWPSWPLIGWDIFSAPEPKAQMHYCDHALSAVRLSSLTFHIFNFSSKTAEQNSMKLDRKQDLNVLYQVCVFLADRKN